MIGLFRIGYLVNLTALLVRYALVEFEQLRAGAQAYPILCVGSVCKVALIAFGVSRLWAAAMSIGQVTPPRTYGHIRKMQRIAQAGIWMGAFLGSANLAAIMVLGSPWVFVSQTSGSAGVLLCALLTSDVGLVGLVLYEASCLLAYREQSVEKFGVTAR